MLFLISQSLMSMSEISGLLTSVFSFLVGFWLLRAVVIIALLVVIGFYIRRWR